MKDKITVAFSSGSRWNNVPLTLHLKRCITAALRAEGVPVPCEINVLITDDDAIQALNKAQRGVDRPTDVLSFPMFAFTPGQLPEDLHRLLDPETGLLPLGDMAISWERVKAQAEALGHSRKRELGYLTIHSVLHLLGYDHVDEGEMKRQMRAREKAICQQMDLKR